MSIDGVSDWQNPYSTPVESTDGTDTAVPKAPPLVQANNNSASAWADGAAANAHTTSGTHDGFDIGSMLSSILGAGQGVKTTGQQASKFDFTAMLAKIFDSVMRNSKDDSAPAAQETSPAVSNAKFAKPSDTPSGQSSSAPGGANIGVQAGVHTEGQTSIGGATFKGAASASAGATASASGGTFAGPDGIGVKGSVEARIGVSASASGSITSKYGSIRGTVGCSAEIYARAQGYALVNGKGASAGGDAQVGAHVEAHATADAEALGGVVAGHADADAEAGAGAKAGAKVGVSYDPLRASVDASAGAFAGARAGFNAKGGVAGFNYGITAEAWTGVGAKAEVHAGLEDGKFKFSFGVGVACGIGCFLKFDFEIDLKGVTKAIGAIGDFLGNLFGGGKPASGAANDSSQAVNAIGEAVQKYGPQATKMLIDAWKKLGGDDDSKTPEPDKGTAADLDPNAPATRATDDLDNSSPASADDATALA
jgi:hypothetical protein